MIELLVVISIVAIMVGLTAPSLSRLKGVDDVTVSAHNLKDIFDQARTYAMVNNTYVWVGIFEEDASLPSQIPAKSGKGRLVVSIVASRDGTRGYDPAIAQSDISHALASSKLVQLGKLQKLENIHIFDASARAIGKRPAGVVSAADIVGLASIPQLFTFQYPLTGTVIYTYGLGPSPGANGIIQFTPSGEAIAGSGSVKALSSILEVAIREARYDNDDVKNVAALNISGITGQTTMFLP